MDLALAVAPLTIVTNGLLLDDDTVAFLSDRIGAARYSLDLRVSLDGMTAAQNDPVRGRGTFEGVVSALRRLATTGILPVVSVVEHEAGLEGAEARIRFLEFLRQTGIRQPRVKFLPHLRIGREVRRTHGYGAKDALEETLAPDVESTLLCASGRCVTANGVYPCPILVERRSARLGATLSETAHPIRLGFDACRTCVLDGLRCNT